jgi:hypothetical protein
MATEVKCTSMEKRKRQGCPEQDGSTAAPVIILNEEENDNVKRCRAFIPLCFCLLTAPAASNEN